eukprot:3049468-Rhodomonas_salina.2
MAELEARVEEKAGSLLRSLEASRAQSAAHSEWRQRCQTSGKQEAQRVLKRLRREAEDKDPAGAGQQGGKVGSLESDVRASLNVLPSAYLAQPQCSRRLFAAVSLLSRASQALPLVSRASSNHFADADLAASIGFLVAPSERPRSATLAHCIDLFQQATSITSNAMSCVSPALAPVGGRTPSIPPRSA